MKSVSINVLLVSTLSLSSFIVNGEDRVPAEDINEARSLIKAFGSDLKSVLNGAMKTDGPIKALEVCNIEAGPIADKNSDLSDWTIARTSLKIRNESNAPDEWESAVLEEFENRKKSGEALKTMDYSEVVKDGDKLLYRYMKAIPTVGLCLTCHGENISDEIRHKVKSLYPNDQATGFILSDIRGAFTLKREAH